MKFHSNDTRVPKLRFPEFNGEWRIKKLGDFADVSKLAGFEFTKYVLYSDIGKLIGLRGLNIKHNTLDLKDVKYVDGSDLSKLNRSKLYIDDMMFTYVGTVGEVALIEEDNRFYLAPNVSRIRFDKSKALPRFINTYFQNDTFKNKEINTLIATSSQPALSMTNIRKFKLFLPSLEEQEKIAGFLTVVDERIAVMDKKVELLQQYKKGVMQKIFNQKLQFKDEKGNDYPNWETKKLGGVVTIKTGKKDVNQGNPNGQYPFFTCAREHTYSDEYSFEGEAIMIAGNGEVGLCAYYEGKFEAYQRTYVLQEFSVPAKYLFIYLKSAFQDFAESQKQQGSMPYIKLATLQDFAVPIQSEAEQQKIADFLTSLDDKINLEKTKLEQAKLFKKSLLQRMFV